MLKHIVPITCRVHRAVYYLVVDSETGLVEATINEQRAQRLMSSQAPPAGALPGYGARGDRYALPASRGGHSWSREQGSIEQYRGGGPPAQPARYDAPTTEEVVIRGSKIPFRCPFCGGDSFALCGCGSIHCASGLGLRCTCPVCGDTHRHVRGDIRASGSRLESSPQGLGGPPRGGGPGLPRERGGNPGSPALPPS